MVYVGGLGISSSDKDDSPHHHRRYALKFKQRETSARFSTFDQESLSLITKLRERGHGSVLRGWRRELDPDGSLDVTFQDFCKAAARMGFKGDTHELFTGSNGGMPKNLTLAEFTPYEGNLVSRFRHWVKEEFGGPMPMFAAMDVTLDAQDHLYSQDSHVTPESFFQVCKERGFRATDDELTELWCCADVDDSGAITRDEVIFLETDPAVRDLETFKYKFSRKEQYQRHMAWVYLDDSRKAVPPTHRSARRPWLASHFERLPVLVCHKQAQWKQVAYRRSVQARITFLRHLRARYGNEVRGWRQGLDPDDQFVVSRVTLRRYCRQVDLRVNLDDLWKSLDKDCDGHFRLEELYVKAADILASFQLWAVRTYGSVEALWNLPETLRAHGETRRTSTWASNKKLLTATFEEVLKQVGWPPARDAAATKFLSSLLDLHGCGFICLQDLQWLGKWEPPQWLCAEPDPAAWEEIRTLMMRAYNHPLKAWRSLLDLDNSNSVSWIEFNRACQKLKFDGNIGGAWRVLDVDLSGSISMLEFDKPSASLLRSFKDWAEVNFGSVAMTFKSLDTSGNHMISYSDLKRACTKLKYEGEVRLLFDCLDSDRKGEDKRAIHLKEVLFLDSWEDSPTLEQRCEEDLVRQAVTAKHSETPTHKKRNKKSVLRSLPSGMMNAKTTNEFVLHKGKGTRRHGILMADLKRNFSRTFSIQSSGSPVTRIPSSPNAAGDVPRSQSAPALSPYGGATPLPFLDRARTVHEANRRRGRVFRPKMEVHIRSTPASPNATRSTLASASFMDSLDGSRTTNGVEVGFVQGEEQEEAWEEWVNTTPWSVEEEEDD